MNKLDRSSLRLAVLLLLPAMWIGCDSTSVEDKSTGTVSGVVREEGTQRPISDIQVELGGVAQTMTDENGRFEFREVAVGRSLLIKTDVDGFDAYSETLVVQAGENNRDIVLVRTTYFELGTTTHAIYLPPGIPTFRGVIFLAANQDMRGFASGVARVNSPYPDLNEYVAAERQRSLLLAEKHGLALMAVDGTQNENAVQILPALTELAEMSGHPELAQAPVLIMGFSVGGCIAYEFALRHSERVIGFMAQKSSCLAFHNNAFHNDGETLRVPGYLFTGQFDTVNNSTENTTQKFEENRPYGALWALASEPAAGHTWIRDEDLLFNWMDIILEYRLPETVSPGEPVTLNALDESSGWLGNRASFSTAEYACYDEDKHQASWLPSKQSALDWQSFVSAGKVTTTTTCGGSN